MLSEVFFQLPSSCARWLAFLLKASSFTVMFVSVFDFMGGEYCQLSVIASVYLGLERYLGLIWVSSEVLVGFAAVNVCLKSLPTCTTNEEPHWCQTCEEETSASTHATCTDSAPASSPPHPVVSTVHFFLQVTMAAAMTSPDSCSAIVTYLSCICQYVGFQKKGWMNFMHRFTFCCGHFRTSSIRRITFTINAKSF